MGGHDQRHHQWVAYGRSTSQIGQRITSGARPDATGCRWGPHIAREGRCYLGLGYLWEMLRLQRLQFLGELVDIPELAVDAGEADVGDFIDFTEFRKCDFADLAAGHFV